jgi:hypothetical protein
MCIGICFCLQWFVWPDLVISMSDLKGKKMWMMGLVWTQDNFPPRYPLGRGSGLDVS